MRFSCDSRGGYKNGFLSIVDQENVFFPLKYPTSCLLGCVDMLDCLPQDEYREMVRQTDSEDEGNKKYFVICKIC